MRGAGFGHRSKLLWVDLWEDSRLDISVDNVLFRYLWQDWCRGDGDILDIWDILVLVTHKELKKAFIKGEALRLLRRNSSKITFEEKTAKFKLHLLERGYPEDLINTTLSEVNFEDRKLHCRSSTETKEKPTNLEFCHTIPTIST